jgi:hypothetical protein
MNADKQLRELDLGSGQGLGFCRRQAAYIGGCLSVLNIEMSPGYGAVA